MNWPRMVLDDVLQASSAAITLLPDVRYQQAAVGSYPPGVVLKAVKRGFDFPRKEQKQIRAGQFIISQHYVHRKMWGIVPPQLDGAVVNRQYLVFDLHPDLHPDYFAAYLSTPLFNQSAFATCSSAGWLNLRQFKSIVVPLPPRDEQQRVAEVWQHANAALEHTAAMAAGIADIKSGMADKLFREANSSWERTTLGACASIGKDSAGSHTLAVILPDKLVIGSALLEEGGTGIRPGAELDSLFLYYYLEREKESLRAAFSTKAAPESILRALPIFLPTLYEQRKIAAVIRQHDRALIKLRREQAALRRLITGIMHQIFSGTLDWRERMPELTGF